MILVRLACGGAHASTRSLGHIMNDHKLSLQTSPVLARACNVASWSDCSVLTLQFFSMTSQWLFGHLWLCFWCLSLIHMADFDMFDVNAEHVESRRCSLRCAFWFDFMAFMLWGPTIMSAFVLAMTIFFSSLVWRLATMCFVQVGSNGVVAVYVAFTVAALIWTMLYGCVPSF